MPFLLTFIVFQRSQREKMTSLDKFDFAKLLGSDCSNTYTVYTKHL